jgi:hypothetical protein
VRWATSTSSRPLVRLAFARRLEREGRRGRPRRRRDSSDEARQHFGRKYRPDQARAPAGQSDGGQWIAEASNGAPVLVETNPGGAGWLTAVSEPRAVDGIRESVVTTPDGVAIREQINVSSDVVEWDARHTVVGRDGEATVFERTGDVQVAMNGDDVFVGAGRLMRLVPHLRALGLAVDALGRWAPPIADLESMPAEGVFDRVAGDAQTLYDTLAARGGESVAILQQGYDPRSWERAMETMSSQRSTMSGARWGTAVPKTWGDDLKAMGNRDIAVEYSAAGGTRASYGRRIASAPTSSSVFALPTACGCVSTMARPAIPARRTPCAPTHSSRACLRGARTGARSHGDWNASETMTSKAKRIAKIFVSSNPDVVHMHSGIHVGEVTWLARPIWLEHFLMGTNVRAICGIGPLIGAFAGTKFCYMQEIPLYLSPTCAKMGFQISDDAEMAMFMDHVQNRIIPDSRAARTFEDYLDHVWNRWRGRDVPARGRFEAHLLAGDFEEAIVRLDERHAEKRRWAIAFDPKTLAWEFERDANPRALLVARDAPAIANILRQREVASIAKLGLTKYWRKRPHPFEERFGLV